MNNDSFGLYHDYFGWNIWISSSFAFIWLAISVRTDMILQGGAP